MCEIFNKELLNKKFPDFKINNKTKTITKQESNRFRGSVRINQGLFYTDSEFKKRKKELEAVTLP